MSYTIRKSDGTTLTVVPENEIITDVVPVALVGRGAVEYGEPHSNNFVHLLENFANTVPPANPMTGMLWFDTSAGAMKVYKDSAWETVGSGGGNGSGVISVMIGSDSVLVFAAGGKVIAVLSPSDISNGNLPVSVAILNQLLPFRSRFPNGIEAGHNLATDSTDYIYNGHVRAADASTWAGGGSPFAATTYVDLGATSIALSIANNVIIAAYSQAAIANGSLPSSFVINGITMPFAAAFPQGLVAGLTLASDFAIGIGGGTISGSNTGVTLSTVQSLVDGEASARASAITTLSSQVSSTYATASRVTTIEAAFISGTGQSSLSSAVDYLIASATGGTANAEAVTALRSEITNAITGSTSFANALSKINTSVAGTWASSAAFNELLSEIRTGVNAVSTAAIHTNLQTLVNQSSANASSLNSIVSTFTSATGETNVASAINRIWTEATASGSSSTWELDIDSGGKVAGIQLTANSATKSDVNIRADMFSFWHPTSPTIKPFYIKDNKVYIANLVIEDGSIGTDKLSTLFVTEEVYKGTITAMPAGNVAIAGLQVSTGPVQRGSKVVIMFSCNVYGSDAGGMWSTVRRSDGKWLTGRAEYGCPDEGGSSQGWNWSDTIPVDGTYSYQVWGERFGTCNLKNAHLIGIVQKQHNGVAADSGSTTPPAAEVVYDGESDYSGSGSTTSGTDGTGYGGAGCVVPSSYMPNGKTAGDIQDNDELTVLDYHSMDKFVRGKVDYHRLIDGQPCIKLKSESGIWVECSLSTPLTLRDGTVVYGREVLDKELAVLDENGFRWEKIVSITNTGNKTVVLIAAQNQTYAAGGEDGRYIFTHNPLYVQKL